jgi:hypothetical protein
LTSQAFTALRARQQLTTKRLEELMQKVLERMLHGARTTRATFTPWEALRRDWCISNHTVLANAHKKVLPSGGSDAVLIGWARHTGRLVHIDRPSVWGNSTLLANPHDDAEREASVRKYARWFTTQYALHQRLDELAGKVLLCWCSPQRCHGEVLMGMLDPQFTAEYIATYEKILATTGRVTPARSGRRVSSTPQLELW